MLDLEPTAMQFNEAVFGLIAFVILTVVVCLFIFNKYNEEKRKNRILSKAASGDSAIVSFLTTQFTNTKTHNRQTNDPEHHLHKEVVQLRSAYLKIEEKAIAKKIDSQQYWQHLNDNLLKLVKIVFPQALNRNHEVAELETKIALLKDRINHIPNSNDNPRVEQHKARAIASLEQIRKQPSKPGYSRNKLQQQLEKLETVVGIFEDPQARRQFLVRTKQESYLKNSERHTDELEQIYDRSSKSVASLEVDSQRSGEGAEELLRFKNENLALAQQIANMKDELSKFKARLPDTSGEQPLHEKARTNLNELSDITDELIESNEKEIDRLRDIIANQRSSIFEMEESLNSLEKFTQNGSDAEPPEIEKLKRCIAESEVCIGMLEQELNDLKADLDSLRDSKVGDDLTVAESEELSNHLSQLKLEIEASHNQISAFEQLSSYTNDALAAGSVEDVALLVYEAIVRLNYAPLLLIKSPERTIELCSSGSIAVREKVLVNNMQINEISPGAQGRIAFRFLNLAGIVRPPDEFDIDESDRQLIIKIFKVTDKIIGLLTLAHKAKHFSRTRDDAVNSIKRMSYDLDKNIEDYGNRSKTVVSRNFKQVSDFMRAKGMSATQVAAIHNIEQETLKQIEASKTLRLKSRKNFLALLQELEKND